MKNLRFLPRNLLPDRGRAYLGATSPPRLDHEDRFNPHPFLDEKPWETNPGTATRKLHILCACQVIQ